MQIRKKPEVLNMNISLNNCIIRLHFDTQVNQANCEHIFIMELYCFQMRMYTCKLLVQGMASSMCKYM